MRYFVQNPAQKILRDSQRELCLEVLEELRDRNPERFKNRLFAGDLQLRNSVRFSERRF